MGSQTSVMSCTCRCFRRVCGLATYLELHQILLNFAKEFVTVLFMMFICSLDENIRTGGLVGTQICVPTN